MPNFLVRLCAMIAAISLITGVGRWPNIWFFIDVFMLIVWSSMEWKLYKQKK